MASNESTKKILQPDIPAFVQTRSINADLHYHRKTSSNMKGTFNSTIDTAQKRLGPGGLLALVNFQDSRYERFSEEAGYERKKFGNAIYVPQKDILVIRGQEIPTKEGHILVLGLNRGNHLKSGRPLLDTLNEAVDNNGITVADHPFYVEGIGPFLAENYKDTIECLDAIEGYNSQASLYIPGLTTANANKEAQLAYNFIQHNAQHLGFISVSDGHSLSELGRSYTTLQMPHYEDIKNGYTLRNNLREAIRKSKPQNCIMKPAKFGALCHLGALAVLAARSKL